MKFLVPLLIVSTIALTSAFVLRWLMVNEFEQHLKGEKKAAVLWLVKHLEESFEVHEGWDRESLCEDAIWVMLFGVEMRLRDMEGSVVVDTAKALASLPLRAGEELVALLEHTPDEDCNFTTYPIRSGDREIAQLDVRFMESRKEDLLVQRSNMLMLGSLLVLGGAAIGLSFVFSREMIRPIERLSSAARAISEGDLRTRVDEAGGDEIGRLGESFNRMARSLDLLETLRKRIITNVAHELRTPLGAIRGQIEGMVDGLLPTDKEHLQSLYEEVVRLRKILEGIEDVAQAEVSALTLNRERLEVAPFLRNILDRYGKAFHDKGVGTDLDCTESLTAYADPDKLSQILINLLTNALKATERGGKISVKAWRDKEGFSLEVSDDGQGIKPDDLPFIFERFYRTSPEGLGLGLAIAKELVQAHGGSIEAKSEQGKGATFTVRLPHS
jgi:two-component system sensor histidine kinase BaeS